MAWPTLNERPDYQAGREFTPRIDSVQFQGYQQDSAAGINSTLESYSVTFKRSPAAALALYEKLRSWKGVQRFKFRVRDSEPLRGFKTSGKVSITYDNFGFSTVTATFQEVNEVET